MSSFRSIRGTTARLGLVLAVLAAGTSGRSLRAETGFTYQGQLKDGGVAANGSYDLTFRLFDGAVDGAQVAGDLVVPNTPVVNGVFATLLDFGVEPWTANLPRWLEITVNGQALSPRTAITPVPFSLNTRGLNVDADGKVGIGTAEPAQQLSVAGVVQSSTGGFMFPDGTVQASAATGGSGFWTSSGTNIFNNNSGNVGVGTSTPDGRLHVTGGATWTSNAWAKSIAIADAGAIEFGYGASSTRFGLGSSQNGLYFFRTTTEGTAAAANYFMFADSSGNVGVNTLTPAARLHVRNTGIFSGGLAVLGETSSHVGVTGTANDPAGIGGRFANTAAGVALKSEGLLLVEKSGDGAELLRFETERPWVFRQAYTGSGTALRLQPTVGLKNFEVTAAGGTNVATFVGNDADPRLIVNGTMSTKVLEITGADVAEKFPTREEKPEPGTVMEIDADHPGELRVSRGAYSPRVAGVVSGAGGLSVGAVLGNLPGHEDAPAIALSGRVWVRCEAESEAIAPGDLLTSSDKIGYAMKASDRELSHGAVLGKAMTALSRGETALVLVLVNLQ